MGVIAPCHPDSNTAGTIRPASQAWTHWSQRMHFAKKPSSSLMTPGGRSTLGSPVVLSELLSRPTATAPVPSATNASRRVGSNSLPHTRPGADFGSNSMDFVGQAGAQSMHMMHSAGSLLKSTWSMAPIGQVGLQCAHFTQLSLTFRLNSENLESRPIVAPSGQM